MYWGAGSALGLLATLGYAVFVAGAILLWFGRSDVPVWVHDEVGAIRRNFARHAVIGGFAGLREECRLKVAPSGFRRSLERISRRRINRGAILLMIGPFLFLLDFFI
ncbi:MAG TPA: hypothetical protein VGI16_06185 [Candidatus Acidoferrum sp.]|jgi:hypothetical protein